MRTTYDPREVSLTAENIGSCSCSWKVNAEVPHSFSRSLEGALLLLAELSFELATLCSVKSAPLERRLYGRLALTAVAMSAVCKLLARTGAVALSPLTIVR